MVPLLIAVQLVFIAVWSRRRTPRARWAVLVGFVVFPLLILLQALVVTDRERLVRVCNSLAAAYRDADLAEFERHISDTFAADTGRGGTSWDKAALLDRLEQQLLVYRIEEPRLRQFETQVQGDRATAQFVATCRIIAPDRIVSSILSKWQLEFRKVDGQWKVEVIQPVSIPLFPYRRLDDLPR